MNTSFKRASTASSQQSSLTSNVSENAASNNLKSQATKSYSIGSCGIPSFDSLLLSGGLSTSQGTLMVIYKDEKEHFSNLFKKLFLAAGICSLDLTESSQTATASEGAASAVVASVDIGTDASFRVI